MVIRKQNGPLPPDHPLSGTRIIFRTKRPTAEEFARLKAKLNPAPADADTATETGVRPTPDEANEP